MPSESGSQFDTKAVIDGLRDDDSRTQQLVFDQYHRRLVNMIRSNVGGRLTRRMDASDVAMSAFRSFFLHARRGSFEIENRRQLWSLLVTITLNKLRNQVRFHNAEKRAPDREEHDVGVSRGLASEELTPSEAAVLNNELELVLTQVKPFHREIAERILVGQTSAEIARATDRSLRTVRRVEAILRKLVENQLGNDGQAT